MNFISYLVMYKNTNAGQYNRQRYSGSLNLYLFYDLRCFICVEWVRIKYIRIITHILHAARTRSHWCPFCIATTACSMYVNIWNPCVRGLFRVIYSRWFCLAHNRSRWRRGERKHTQSPPTVIDHLKPVWYHYTIYIRFLVRWWCCVVAKRRSHAVCLLCNNNNTLLEL